MSGRSGLRVATARTLTDAERAAATRMVRRNATDADDEQHLLDALGLTEEVGGR